MKSAILVESKKPLVVAEIDLPTKLEFGQVLVKVCYSGICGAQINEIDAIKGPDKFLDLRAATINKFAELPELVSTPCLVSRCAGNSNSNFLANKSINPIIKKAGESP